MTRHELKKYRQRLKLSQVELAAHLNIDVMTVSRYERGVLLIPRLVALAVAAMKPDPKKPPVHIGRPPKEAK